MPELKSCPFCGGNNVEVRCQTFVGIYRKDYAVFCYDCHFGLAWKDTEREAIEAWNRRADNDSNQ